MKTLTIHKGYVGAVCLGDLVCTFDTIETRDYIESLVLHLDLGKETELPRGYTFDVVPSTLYGEVAKIKKVEKKKPLKLELTIPQGIALVGLAVYGVLSFITDILTK